MKRFFAISLAVIYLSISSGIVVNLHYCMGKLADIAFGHSESNKCARCGMDNKGCCHDDVKVVKLQDSHQVFNVQADIAKAEAQAPAHSHWVNWQLRSSNSNTFHSNHSPPSSEDLSLTIMNCVFRI